MMVMAMSKKELIDDRIGSDSAVKYYIHDIGKMRIPVSILCKPGRLEPDEYEIMKKHVVYTKEIIEGCFSYKIIDIVTTKGFSPMIYTQIREVDFH